MEVTMGIADTEQARLKGVKMRGLLNSYWRRNKSTLMASGSIALGAGLFIAGILVHAKFSRPSNRTDIRM